MSNDFAYDVFLSHSAKDKPIVRDIAERLRKDGIKVWFDEWEIKPGDSIPARIEAGLERSRVLVLCMSANAFGSDWVQLESATFRFRDPLNKERRFLPLRFDDAPINGSLVQFLYIRWLPEDRDQEYAKLLQASRPPDSNNDSSSIQPEDEHACLAIQLDTQEFITVYAFSANGKLVLTGGTDKHVRLWSAESGRCIRVVGIHDGDVTTVAWSTDHTRSISGTGNHLVSLWNMANRCPIRILGDPKQPFWSSTATVWSDKIPAIASGGNDGSVRVWEVGKGDILRVLTGPTSMVLAVTMSRDNRYVLSGSNDGSIRFWDVKLGECLRVYSGHKKGVNCVALSIDKQMGLSASSDHTLRLWDIASGRCKRVLEGHTGEVQCVVCSADNRHAISGSVDKTVRLWDLETGRCLRVLKGHKAGVRTLALSDDGSRVFSGDSCGGIRMWFLSELLAEAEATNTRKPLAVTVPDQVQYTNAKVLLVGDTGVGKSGLSNYLAHGIKVEDDKPIPSTDGAWATHWPLRHTQKEAGVEREIWLWDFAGQVDYRLVHQLFMDDTAAAVLVFNPQSENPFEGLGNWDRDLQKSARKRFAKLLAAGRVDRGGLVVSDVSMNKFMSERSFLSPLHLTSAKTETGCAQLRDAIVEAIDWKSIPETTSPTLYRRMKQEILGLRDTGILLIRLAELKQRMEMTLHGEDFEPEELEAVVRLLSGPGIIQRLDFGGFTLLRPEVLSRYAAAVVRKVRQHPQEMGCIREDELLAGDLDYQDFKRLPREDEAVVLRALLETFISRAWCLRQPCDGTAVLTFPSYFRRERKEQPSHPSVLVTYRFDGPTDDIYATLVVWLHHTVAFESTELWRSAADFKTQIGAALGFTLTREGEGASRLEVYFEPDVDPNSRVLFLRYVHEHLIQHAQNVVRLRRYACLNKKCNPDGQPFTDQTKIDKALTPGGKGKVFCPDCGKPIFLHDVIEEKFESPAVKAKVRAMQIEGQKEIDNESRELMAVHHTGFIVAEAGQIYRGYTNSDHGIDGEIELKDDDGRATGKRLYVQLKSGDSYLTERKRDGVEVFQIKNSRWADYWQQQAYAVMLVIRTSDGEIRWMDVSSYLKRESTGGKIVKQIEFTGERFDVMSVRRWREKVLGK